MKSTISRRRFLRGTAVACAFTWVSSKPSTHAADASGLDFPLVDLHVHLDNSTIDKVFPLSTERGIKFGIVEHAGTKENVYPVVLSNDAELKRYIAMLDGKPVYKGIQAEWTDWMGCFSLEALSQLDAQVLCTGHRLVMTGPDAKSHMNQSPEAAAHYVAMVEECLRLEKGDIERAALRVKAIEWDQRAWPKQPEQAYLINTKVRVKAVWEQMQGLGMDG